MAIYLAIPNVAVMYSGASLRSWYQLSLPYHGQRTNQYQLGISHLGQSEDIRTIMNPSSRKGDQFQQRVLPAQQVQSGVQTLTKLCLSSKAWEDILICALRGRQKRCRKRHWLISCLTWVGMTVRSYAAIHLFTPTSEACNWDTCPYVLATIYDYWVLSAESLFLNNYYTATRKSAVTS